MSWARYAYAIPILILLGLYLNEDRGSCAPCETDGDTNSTDDDGTTRRRTTPKRAPLNADILKKYILVEKFNVFTILPEGLPSGGTASCLIPTFQTFRHHYGRHLLYTCLRKRRPAACSQQSYELAVQYSVFIARALSFPCPYKDNRGCHINYGDTMIGVGNLFAIRDAIFRAYSNNLPGHYMETGVWRGGASVFARAMHLALEYKRRTYVMDSFKGLPQARDVGMQYGDHMWFKNKGLVVDQAWVHETFRNYCVYDAEAVVYGKGYFKDTIPPLREEFLATKQTFSNVRLDGDMYESTIDVLCFTYDLLDVGGTVLVDDFRWDRVIYGAQHAVIQFRKIYGIDGDGSDPEEAMHRVSVQGAFWVKRKQITGEFSPQSCMKALKRSAPVKSHEYQSLTSLWETLHDPEEYTTLYFA
eukprot:PhF_6_TR28113/c0_g1_i3/m.41579